MRSGLCFLVREQSLSMSRTPSMVLPEPFALDRFAADNTGELPRVGVLGVGVLDATGGALGAEEGAGVGHA